jgi:hypothetical protein
MSPRTRSASCFTGAALAASLTLVGSASPAGADKPIRSCTRSYAVISESALRARFPYHEGFEELFDAIDKNGDLLLCAKHVPGLFNTVDNTANQ